MSSYSIELKRLVSKYKYLQQELEYFNELRGEYERDFKQNILESGYEMIIPIICSGDTQNEDSTITEQLPTKFKKLFRKIVSLTHPDKLKDKGEKTIIERRTLYETAVNASKIGERGVLIIIAIELDIDVEEFKDDIEEINIACNNIKEQIDGFCKRSSYYWYNLKSDKEKDEFIKKFIDSSLKHNNIKKNKKC